MKTIFSTKINNYTLYRIVEFVPTTNALNTADTNRYAVYEDDLACKYPQYPFPIPPQYAQCGYNNFGYTPYTGFSPYGNMQYPSKLIGNGSTLEECCNLIRTRIDTFLVSTNEAIEVLNKYKSMSESAIKDLDKIMAIESTREDVKNDE